VQGSYLDWQIRHNLIRPIVAFRAYIFRDVLPQFNNLDQRAEQVATEYYEQVTSQPAPEDFDGDLSGFAEDANDEAIGWYQMMRSLRQTMLNLLAAGLYHLTEQQLAMLCRDGGFSVAPPEETHFSKVSSWYKQHLQLNLESLPSYQLLNELKHVANTVKHGKGPACDKLKELRPELFTDPAFAKFLGGMGVDPKEDLQQKVVEAPLAGDDLFVTEDGLRKYAEGAESFFLEIADHFTAHAETFY
jgi:hypothetical protein